MKARPKYTRGFTIVELLIVIVVIAILAAITIVAYSGIQAKARDNIRIHDLKQIQKIVELYRVDNGQYPLPATGSGSWSGACTGYGSKNPYILSVEGYAARLPLEPKTWSGVDVSSHCYLYRSDGIDFMILAHMSMEAICGGDPGNACNSADIRALDRTGATQPTIAVYSPGAISW